MKYKCSHFSCPYKTIRLDNFNRHVKSHSDVRIKCDCGISLAATSIGRHRQSARHIAFMRRNKNQPPNENQSTNENQLTNENQPANEMCVNITTTIKIKTLSDGKIIIDQDPIQFGNMSFVVVPSYLLNETEQ